MYRIQITSQYNDTIEYYAKDLRGAHNGLFTLMHPSLWGNDVWLEVRKVIQEMWFPMDKDINENYRGWRKGSDRGTVTITYLKLWE